MKKIISLLTFAILIVKAQFFAQLTTVSAGTCSGCESLVNVTFDGCSDCIDINSCKELSNVVLLLCDGTEFKYDGLNGYNGTFCSPDGQDIIGVWVKSGCYLSGDGPGYGYFIESPCGSSSGSNSIPNETISDGECTGCNSYVEANFNGCSDCIDISSCKDLSNVVLLLCDGTEFKYDNLSGYTGTFCSPDGQNIIGVWIKSGCYLSGDGPGYGYFLEGPCTSENCSSDLPCTGPNAQRPNFQRSSGFDSFAEKEGLNTSIDQSAEFILFNISGQKVFSQKILLQGDNKFQMPIMSNSGLPSGIYIYHVNGKNTVLHGELFLR